MTLTSRIGRNGIGRRMPAPLHPPRKLRSAPVPGRSNVGPSNASGFFTAPLLSTSLRLGTGALRGRGMLLVSVVLLLVLLGANTAFAEQRFPPPEFESGHQLPITTTPPARAIVFQYVDVAVLAACLGLAAWLSLKRRSRNGIIGLSLFSLLYFGVYRKGCICAIGSVQNVALCLFDPGYAVPLSVLAFFMLPLGVALFAGRAFCSGVCPHGVLQDLVLVRPVKVPPWLEHVLGLIPFFFLGAGVVFAATGAGFIICRLDPFVPLFRFSGDVTMIITGLVFVAAGLFVGRPYCRFLCPYGALLRMASMASKWRVHVTPDACIQCRLCENACPYGAIREPSSGIVSPRDHAKERRRLGWLLLLLPVLMAVGGGLGVNLAVPMSRSHPTVMEAERALHHGTQETAASAENSALLNTAAGIQKRFTLAGGLFGGWIGLVLGLKLISLSVRTLRPDYEPDRGACYSCARCFVSCPNELVRLGRSPASENPRPPSPGKGIPK